MDYCAYTFSDTVGYCEDQVPAEPATNADGTRPTSITQCWAACTVSYGSDLKAIDFWPSLASTNERRGSCFCQTECSALSNDYCSADMPCPYMRDTRPPQFRYAYSTRIRAEKWIRVEYVYVSGGVTRGSTDDVAA